MHQYLSTSLHGPISSAVFKNPLLGNIAFLGNCGLLGGEEGLVVHFFFFLLTLQVVVMYNVASGSWAQAIVHQKAQCVPSAGKLRNNNTKAV